MRLVASALAVLAFLLTPLATLADGRTFALIPYWSDGRQYTWYNFGGRLPVQDGKVVPAPVYVLYNQTDDRGKPVPAQAEIFDVSPGEPGYSDLWQVMLVKVPANYQPDSITSLAQIKAAGLSPIPSETLLNCPFVDQTDVLAGGVKPHQGWLRGQQVWYFDLGTVSSPAYGQVYRFYATKDQQGPVAFPGQLGVSDPTAVPFRQLFWVQVPPDYVANDIKSVAEIKRLGYSITATNTVFNVPLPPPPPTTASRGPSAGGYAVFGVIFLAFLAASYVLLRPAREQPSLAAEPAPGLGTARA